MENSQNKKRFGFQIAIGLLLIGAGWVLSTMLPSTASIVLQKARFSGEARLHTMIALSAIWLLLIFAVSYTVIAIYNAVRSRIA